MNKVEIKNENFVRHKTILKWHTLSCRKENGLVVKPV